MVLRIKHITVGLLGAMMTLPSQPSFAQTVQMSVDANMGFGLIEYSSSHSGELSLGTDGNAVLTGTGLYQAGDPVPAQIGITGTTGVVEIKCDATGALGGANGSTLQITDIEAALAPGLPYGSANACGGMSTDTMTIDLDNSPNPKIFFGGKLNIPTNAMNGESNFQSTNSGGATLTVNAIFQ